MAKRTDIYCRELTVVSHSTKETADRDPVYVVVLKNAATLETDNVVTLTIKSSSDSIFTEYAIKEKIDLKLASAQTKLG